MLTRALPGWQDARQYAEENNLLCMETSAKSGVGVQEIFTVIAQRLPKNEPPRPVDKVDVTADVDTSKKKGCC